MHNEERFTQLTNSRDLVLGTVYGGKSGSEQRYWFEGTPKNIASFLMRHADADNIYITTPLDTPVISSFGCFVDQCPDRSRLRAVMEQLMPMQMGETTPEDFFCPTEEAFDEFCRQAQSADMTMS